MNEKILYDLAEKKKKKENTTMDCLGGKPERVLESEARWGVEPVLETWWATHGGEVPGVVGNGRRNTNLCFSRFIREQGEKGENQNRGSLSQFKVL